MLGWLLRKFCKFCRRSVVSVVLSEEDIFVTRDEILKWFLLEGTIFQIGCTARRLTFHSQQQRAFNLIWALNDKEPVKDKKIVVVGGGLAGLVASSAAYVLGAQVKLYEQKADVLPLQRGNITRYVHPNIYSWPQPGASYPVTHLPYFNWYDSDAGEVAQKIFEQWNEIKSKIDIDNPRRVSRVFMDSSSSKVRLEVEGILDKEPYDVGILAVGFGLEKKLSETGTPSYWRNDDLGQITLGKKPVYRFMVSGAGDGGLLDVIRLKIKDFRHREFLDWLLKNTWFKTQAETVIDAINKEGANAAWKKFENESVPNAVVSFLARVLRDDTEVYLNHRDENHFRSEASFLHRLIVALLIKNGAVYLQRGDYSRFEEIEDKAKLEKELKVFLLTDERERSVIVDRLIVRLGADSELALISAKFPAAQAWWDARIEGDETFNPAYETGFLADEFMEYEWEKSYAVTIALGDRADGHITSLQLATAERVNQVLNQIGKKLGTDNFADKFNPAATKHQLEWRNKKCDIEVSSTGQIRSDRGAVQGPLVKISTDSKQLLEVLLDGDDIRYHRIEFFVTQAATTQHIETRRDLETNAYCYDYRKTSGCITVDCHYGMLQAHKLLRVRTLLEVMANQWHVQRFQTLGWKIQESYGDNRKHWRSVWQAPGQ